ncbi:MAG: 4'-phosphopantetheinyl transferase superfamily protein [Kiritimatiellae bacterium]|nr:4'-phosphopantetheinyl transferase superfamily protein [Kiritimatiellia bacterium]
MNHLVRICAKDCDSLIAEISRTMMFLDRVPEVRFDDVAYTCSFTRGECRLAVIASDVSDLRQRLASARDRIASGAMRLRDKSGTYFFRDGLLASGGKLAFVYAGVMGFYPNMMRDLVIGSGLFRSAFDELEEALASEDGAFTPSNFVFPPAPCYRHDADVFRSGAYAEAFISTYVACHGLGRVLASDGVKPDGVVGFGGGDLAAIMRAIGASERLERPQRIQTLREMYKIVSKSVNHSHASRVVMVTVIMRHQGDADEVVKTFPEDKCTLVVDFSPRQRTYAIAPDFESEALAAFAKADVRTVRLDFDYPFSTPKCKGLASEVRKFLSKWMTKTTELDFYSCASAQKLSTKLKDAREEVAGIWCRPIEFRRTVEKMYEDGYRVFLEVGPRGLMTSAVEDTLKGRDFAAMAINSTHRTARLQALHALAQLIALGADIDCSRWYSDSVRKLDFDSVLALEVRRDDVMRLSRTFPKLTLLGDDNLFGGVSPLSEVRGRGAKAAQRAAVQARRQQQFDWGAINPLLSDAEKTEESPGMLVEVKKNFKFSDNPFLADFALGTSQLSYSDPNLRGMVMLTPPVAIEMMAELAQMVVPNSQIISVCDFKSRRWVKFKNGELKLVLRAERGAATDGGSATVKVVIREDVPDGQFTWPAMEATIVMGASSMRRSEAAVVPSLARPRNVHWSGRDIYPARICYGKRLRGIKFAETWGEEGVDYEVEVPPLAGTVAFTRFPIWAINPLLIGTISSGYTLWRSHEEFSGAFSFPFRVRKLSFLGPLPSEGARLKCYLRLTGVTPRSHLCDITVSDGNGVALMRIEGWEELAERVSVEFRDMIMQPATAFLSRTLTSKQVGDPDTDIATAYIVDPPYAVFERNENLWLDAISSVVLSAHEHGDFERKTRNVPRLTEWLYGRIAAKEAVRRFLRDYYQARWSNADICIYKDERGKPKATGDWKDTITTELDVAIAHTANFIIAIAAANARVGVDVESVARDISDEFAAGAFVDSERDLAASAAQSSQALMRFWCAKEAVSKALGIGIRYSPKEMVVTDYQPDTGRITMRLQGMWVEAFKMFKGRDIIVSSRIVRDHALAFCFIPATILPHDEL